MSNTLQHHGLYSPWNSPRQNTGVGSLSLLQEIFPSQGSNPGPPTLQVDSFQLSHKRSPRALEWVAYPLSSRSSQPRNQTGVSCMAGGFFTNWAIREAPIHKRPNYGGGNKDNGNLLQKVAFTHCCTQGAWPCSRPPMTHTSARDSWILTGKSGSVSCGVTAPFPWVLVHTRFCLCPPRVCFPSPVEVL